MFTSIRIYLALGLGALVLITGGVLIHQRNTARNSRDAALAWQEAVRSDVSRAADVKDKNGDPGLLPLNRVSAQVIYLGKSIDRLRDVADRCAIDAARRAQAYQRTQASDRDNVAKANAAQKADAPRIKALKAIAREAAKGGSCKVPPALLSSAEGL